MGLVIKLVDRLELELADLSATQVFANDLAKTFQSKVHQSGCIIYLHGDLGTGKTTLVRGMLAALGHTGATKSPTYTLVESYDINGMKLEHFDLYRVLDASELEFIGIRDYIDEQAVCIFEWAEKGADHIPAADLEIFLTFNNANGADARKLVLLANSPQGKVVLQSMIKSLRN